jgi:hypothetical protein
MDTTFQYVLKNADKFLKLIETNGTRYQESLNKLFPIINLLVPKYQALYISKFKGHLTKTPQIAQLVSDILISNGEYALAADIYDTKENLEMQISRELTAHLTYNITQYPSLNLRDLIKLSYILKNYIKCYHRNQMY